MTISTESLPAELKEKKLTPRQQAFLDTLFEEAGGNIRTAMDMAGFSKSTRTSEIVHALHDQITELTRQYMATFGPEAMMGMVNVLRDPTQPGATARLNAAEKILDRAGVGKGESIKQEGQIQNIFILPPKGYKQIKASDIIEDVEYEDIPLDTEK